MNQAKINPSVLRWARVRMKLSEAEVARKIGLKEGIERLRKWETGEEFPTFHQAQELARVLHVPFGYLFLSEPPQTTLPIADFRMLPKAQKGEFSPDLEEVLNDARRKSDWLRERRMEAGQSPLPFIGRFSIHTPPKTISDDIRAVLHLPVPTARNAKTWEEHLRILVQHAEQAGIIVLQSGCVGSNTHRKLSVEEFRGFALADPYAPLVFLNARDSIKGRIFTLAHELAHLWTGTSGVSNPLAISPERYEGFFGPNDLERLCNQVAAELLVPEQLLVSRWRNPWTEESVQELAKEFRVSTLVILIRVYETGLIPAREFRAAYEEAVRHMQERIREESSNAGGGDFYRTFYTRNGRILLDEVTQAIREGSLLYREAASLLNINLKTLANVLRG